MPLSPYDNRVLKMTANALLVYGVMAFFYSFYYFFNNIYGAVYGSVWALGYFFIMGIIWFLGYFFMIFFGSFILFKSRKMLLENNRLGCFGAFFGLINIGFPTLLSFSGMLDPFEKYLGRLLAEGIVSLLFFFWFFFHLIMFYLLLSLNHTLKVSAKKEKNPTK